MERPDVGKPVDGPEFRLSRSFMREQPNIWCKVSCPQRLSVAEPKALDGEANPYHDVAPFPRRVVAECSDRVLWRTDRPHTNLQDHMPDDGLLVDCIPHIAPTQKKLLVYKPMRLYGPDEP